MVLLITVPIYRVHQIPSESPGFDIEQYQANLKSNLEARLLTAKLYQQAQAAYRSLDWELEGLAGANHLDESLQIVVAAHRAEIEAELKRSAGNGDDAAVTLLKLAVRYSSEVGQAPTEDEIKWLDENQQTLALLVRAAERGNCLFCDPATNARRKFNRPTCDPLFD